MEIEFGGTAFEWRGPAPFLFVALTPEAVDSVRRLSKEFSYGWGCIPVVALIGSTRFRTSLMPLEGGYVLPLKAVVQRAEGLENGSELSATILFATDPGKVLL